MADGTTTGIWIAEDEREILERFDDYFETYGRPEGRGRDDYSRSGRIKEAMQLYQIAHEAVRQTDEFPHPDELSERALRDLVRSEIKFDD